MKKIILTAAALIAISTTAQADMMNPVTQKKVDQTFSVYVPVIKFGEACKLNDESIKLTEKILSYAYNNFATQPFDKEAINLAFQTAELEVPYKLEKGYRQISNNLSHPTVIDMCSEQKEKMTSMIDKWSQKGY